MARRFSRRDGVLHVEGTSGVVANLYARDRAAARGIRTAVKRNGKDTQQLAQALAPKETQYMAEHVRLDFTPAGLEFVVFLDPDDFEGVTNPVNGRRMTYYPPFVELGTSVSPAQPFLRPAFEQMQPHFRRDVGNEVRKAMRRGR